MPAADGPRPDEPWVEVVNDRLGREVGPVRRLVRARRVRLGGALQRLSRPDPDSTQELDADLQALLDSIGLEWTGREDSARELREIVDRGEVAGLDAHALPHILQAYVRAVGRIVAVEANVAIDALRRVEPEQRPETLARVLDLLLPTSVAGFDSLHRAMLQEALLSVPAITAAETTGVDTAAIAMVDLVRSTQHLTHATSEQLEQLVDALFRAAQAATTGRPVVVVNYVGDGVFLSSFDVLAAADAAWEIVERLERELPLRARGAVAHGPVLQRAGDVFGLPINLSHALTKAARPGTVLLSAEAAALLPTARHGRVRARPLPNPAFGEQQVATLRPAPAR